MTIFSDVGGTPYNNLMTAWNAKQDAGDIWAVRYIDTVMYRTPTHNNFGTKMQTIFRAPATGTYTFYMFVNEFGKFRMSSDETEANVSFRFGGQMIGNWDA